MAERAAHRRTKGGGIFGLGFGSLATAIVSGGLALEEALAVSPS